MTQGFEPNESKPQIAVDRNDIRRIALTRPAYPRRVRSKQTQFAHSDALMVRGDLCRSGSHGGSDDAIPSSHIVGFL